MDFKKAPVATIGRSSLVGVGLYTPAEAATLLDVRAGKIRRWLRGHAIGEQAYDRLWRPQIDLNDGHIYLGFRDLMEVRVANQFISVAKLSARKVRRAIEIAREVTGEERPLSTTWLRTDGRSVFLQVAEEDGGDPRLLDLFRRQYAFKVVIEPSLANIEFDDDGHPLRWWPAGKAAGVVLDPQRAFGRPIDAESSVPTEVLAAAAIAEGSPARAASFFQVPLRSVRRAVAYEAELVRRAA